MINTPKEAAIKIRAALKNLNELVADAYRDHELLVTYELRDQAVCKSPAPHILATVSQEI